jgi:hypothetical protein
MDNCAIYDFETLGQNPESAPVLSLAVLTYNDKMFFKGDGYSYEDLLSRCYYIKFDVKEQIQKYGKKIEKDTAEWWAKQGDEAQKVLKPSTQDKSISVLKSELDNYVGKYFDIKSVFTRGNTFDCRFLEVILGDCGETDPFKWWTIRDSRSFLDALLFTQTDMDNKFLLDEWKEKFVHHDARHDIVVDVLRMQETLRAVFSEELEDIPF